jgi:hypothetical protein
LFMMLTKGPNSLFFIFSFFFVVFTYKRRGVYNSSFGGFFFFLVNLVATCKVVGRSKPLFLVCVLLLIRHMWGMKAMSPPFFCVLVERGKRGGKGFESHFHCFVFSFVSCFFKKVYFVFCLFLGANQML